MDFGLAKSTFLCFTIVVNLIFMSSLWCIDWVREPLRELNCLFYLYIYEFHRDQGWSLSTVKNIFKPPVVYATDCSKAVVPVSFLIQCSFVVYTTGCLIFESLLVVFVFVSPFILAFWSPRLGKRELIFVLLVHLFVCFARICFCLFSLPLGVEGWLRFVTVAYSGLFY